MKTYLLLVNDETYVLQEADNANEARVEANLNWVADRRGVIRSLRVLSEFDEVDLNTFVVGQSL